MIRSLNHHIDIHTFSSSLCSQQPLALLTELLECCSLLLEGGSAVFLLLVLGLVDKVQPCSDEGLMGLRCEWCGEGGPAWRVSHRQVLGLECLLCALMQHHVVVGRRCRRRVILSFFFSSTSLLPSLPQPPQQKRISSVLAFPFSISAFGVSPIKSASSFPFTSPPHTSSSE